MECPVKYGLLPTLKMDLALENNREKFILNYVSDLNLFECIFIQNNYFEHFVKICSYRFLKYKII